MKKGNQGYLFLSTDYKISIIIRNTIFVYCYLYGMKPYHILLYFTIETKQEITHFSRSKLHVPVG